MRTILFTLAAMLIASCAKPIKKKYTHPLFKKIRFEQGTAVISKPSYPALEEIANLLKENPETTYEINVHTDNSLDEATSLKLSEERAEVVKQYLVGKGVPDDKLNAKGYGSSMPLESNDTPEGKAANNRVDFYWFN